MILTSQKERSRFLRFAMVGAFGAVVDFGVMNLLSHYFDMPLVIAGTISFTCAVLSNFTWNRYWTYPESRSRPLMHQLGMFFLVNTAGVLIRIPILHFVEPILLRFFEDGAHLSHLSADFLARNGTLALAVGIVMLWNYFINRHWTYNDVE
ncbi:MAG: GtrA family protein [Chloroflexi bacterium]|nr:GtrA family protein [Chloroflexota bacterium]